MSLAAPGSTPFGDVTGLDRRHCGYELPQSRYTVFQHLLKKRHPPKSLWHGFFFLPLFSFIFSRECGQRPQFLLWYPVKAVLELAKRGLSSESWGNIIQLPPCDPRHTTNPVVHSSVAKEKAPSHNVFCAYAHSEACTHIMHHLHLGT